MLAATRARASLEEMAGWIPGTRTAHLRTGAEMAQFLARECAFDFTATRPSSPPRTVGEGHTHASWLRRRVAEGAAARYGRVARRRRRPTSSSSTSSA